MSKCGAWETFIDVRNIAVWVRQKISHFERLMKIHKVGPSSSVRVRAHTSADLVPAKTPSS